MLVADFDYNLPKELIAQHPLEQRDASRMLVLERETGWLSDAMFLDITSWLNAGDLLVLNDTRVIPARLYARLPTGGRVEFLLLRMKSEGVWTALARPGKKVRPGTRLTFGDYSAEVLEREPDGLRVLRFEPADITALLAEQGELALPSYIHEECENPERYQTVFARKHGAVAAPTAGLHFTPELLSELESMGVEQVVVTLHVGLGTFRPVKTEAVEDHLMHSEEFELSEVAAGKVNDALAAKRRVVCVGTTTVRVLESCAEQATAGWRVRAARGSTNLYIHPGYEWKVAGAMLTNFHVPKSTLLMLVSAFAGREQVLAAYEYAIEQKYRFFSFGDCMLIV